MSKKQETISDIVADIRAQNQGLPEDDYALSPLVCDLLRIADRIEAAAKREREAGAKAAQIREMFDFKINEIESMKDATLDGCFEHQEQNVIKLCAKLDFYEFAKYTLSQLRREGGSVHY